ncbi:hypothetical protein G6L97_26735 (plasmid) [Agrobacterium tumefaciens]|uniref:hypothetical protein n=1 Tax=Agrobacterium tumefaciens TaxID=358 RepID=UPI0015738080|nr:hypothetical protein [Agrobacterium tumefaciens]NSZ87592.1 hypothetical protein [Agrobacterium tumefaciens]WCA72918.1 hypothetical protein G6L97_26735 [Agrobacterium tumefaciens]
MSAKITAAAKATETIQNHIDEAALALKVTTVNGHGVYSDTSSLYRDLTTAQAEISAALAAFTAAQWPTNADYEAEEA